MADSESESESHQCDDSDGHSKKLDPSSQPVPILQKAHVPAFTEPVKQTLLSLHQRGMTGWGLKKSHLIAIAEEKTGLKLDQIQVNIEVLRYKSTGVPYHVDGATALPCMQLDQYNY